MIIKNKESSSGFDTIDRILENIFNYDIQTKNTTSDRLDSSSLDTNKTSKRNSNIFRSIEKIESPSSPKVNSMSKKFKINKLLELKRDYSLSYVDSDSSAKKDHFPQKNENFINIKKCDFKNELLQHKVRRLILRINAAQALTPEEAPGPNEIKARKRPKRKKSVSFSLQPTFYSYSYHARNNLIKSESTDSLAQSILKKLDKVLEDNSHGNPVKRITHEETLKSDLPIRETFQPFQKQLFKMKRFKDYQSESIQTLAEDALEPRQIDDIAELKRNSDSKNEILNAKNDKKNDLNKLDDETFSKEINSMNQTKNMKIILIERHPYLADFPQKKWEPTQKQPCQQDKLNQAFEKIEKILRVNGNFHYLNIKNSFTDFINKIV